MAAIGGTPLADSAKRPTIVLFDLDGTLVHHVNPRVLQTLEMLDDLSHGAVRLVARFRLLRRQTRATRKSPPRLVVHRIIHRFRRKSVAQMLQPCATMRSVLERLAAEGVLLGLVSNGLGRGYGHDVVETFDLRRFFNSLVFREDVSRGKPSPDSLVASLQSIGRNLRANDVIWYIGDQRKDISAALAASDVVGRPIRPFALGPRAASGARQAQLHASQVMWTAADFDKLVSAMFPKRDKQPVTLDLTPAPLL
ncbi:MAG: HAD hydrolase-like protein [Devosia sp.]|uniref:HAD family hydrolase n=1 Tax=Devosia sp. TaxID=1871048 RepID=UPI0024CD3E8D|nr:HAD hydrolase-like protein [Devosia sp.]UYO00030.1 MAG: HAD hydrolase-like protein [Devosia sp.]